MDYTTCMTVIIICLFAMGCLCCVWIFCCGIALMETKYATTLENLTQKTATANGSQFYQCSCHNTTLSLNEKQNTSQKNSIETKMNETQSRESLQDCQLSVIPLSSAIPLSIANIDLNSPLVNEKSDITS